MKSMISDSLDEPAAPKAMGVMRNDHSCCHGSNSEDEGSRGGSASPPTHNKNSSTIIVYESAIPILCSQLNPG